MREIISRAEPIQSTALTLVFVGLAIWLVVVTIDFVIQVFGPANPMVMGADLATGFALIGLMTVVYYRLFVPHRIEIEQDEDLW